MTCTTTNTGCGSSGGKAFELAVSVTSTTAGSEDAASWTVTARPPTRPAPTAASRNGWTARRTRQLGRAAATAISTAATSLVVSGAHVVSALPVLSPSASGTVT